MIRIWEIEIRVREVMRDENKNEEKKRIEKKREKDDLR